MSLILKVHMRPEIILISVLLSTGNLMVCSERPKDNPFDPSGHEPVTMHVLSYDQSVRLSWGDPDLVDYSGFNVYRKAEGIDKSFVRIAEDMLPTRREFTDYQVNYHTTYTYYITVVGSNMESHPSNNVSITPGPGYVWIVDNHNFEILKTTYDSKYIIRTYSTNWPPTDMAFAADLEVGIILYLGNGIIEKIDITGAFQKRYEQIAHPGAVAYDPVGSKFWITDTSGILYTLNPRTDEIYVVSTSLSEPVDIHIAPENDIISVCDFKAKEIVQFDRYGQLNNQIRTINDQPLEGPTRFILNESDNRIWLIDGRLGAEYVYTRLRSEKQFTRADSVRNAGDLEISLLDESAWFVLFNYQDSRVVQLSAEGSRQLELSAMYNPYDLEVNPYDGTLLVADTGNGRVIHYNSTFEIIGTHGDLSFPVKVVVQ